MPKQYLHKPYTNRHEVIKEEAPTARQRIKVIFLREVSSNWLSVLLCLFVFGFCLFLFVCFNYMNAQLLEVVLMQRLSSKGQRNILVYSSH